jgi:hypothetical protein
MPTLDKASLLVSLAPPLHRRLTEQLLDEFISLERRFVLRDWEPATLDGGQFSEAAARIVYHQDSGTLNLRKGVDPCLSYVEDPNNSNQHSFPNRKASLHLAKVIRTVYKLRSDRGAVHIDPNYTANHLDSKVVLENCRWVLSEIIRIFWNSDRTEVARVIREIVQYDIPVIGIFGDRRIVQRTDCSPEEEVLILLHHAGEIGLSRYDLGRYVMCSASTITRTIASLCKPDKRQVVKIQNYKYRLTDLGINRVLSELGEKLAL